MLEELPNLILGPFGALVVMAIVLYGLYHVGTKHLLPLVKGAVDRHLDQVDHMLEEHSQDRELYRSTIERIVDRLDKVEDDVSYIKGRIDNDTKENKFQ